MPETTTEGIRAKLYKCKECGYEKSIQTNHYGECYSCGDWNNCPNQHLEPPNHKYPQLVIRKITVWVCQEEPPEGMWKPISSLYHSDTARRLD